MSSIQRTPLMVAAASDRVDAARCLIDKGADINVKDKSGVREWDYTAFLSGCIINKMK